MTNEAKTYTLVFTDAELNVIYDALREFSYMTDDTENLELISDIEDKIYQETK